jgi:hypothetical protein
MSLVRTQAEIDAEIAALAAIKPLVPSMNAFGESNRAAITAQQAVLTNQTSLAELANKYGNKLNGEMPYAFQSAIHAASWLEGDTDIDAPSVSWAPTVGQ